MEYIKYIAIVSKLENGKYKITFPDFDNIFTNSDSEENITKVATNLLEFKIKEYAENNTPLPEATSIFDVQKTLKDGEISLYVNAKKFSNKSVNNFIETENLKTEKIKTENTKSTDIEDKVLNLYKKYHEKISLAKIVCAVAYLLASFLGVVVAEAPILGKLKVTYLTGMIFDNPFLIELLKRMPNSQIFITAIRACGLLMIFSAIFILVVEFLKLKDYSICSAATPIVLSLIICITFNIKLNSSIPNEVRGFVSLGSGVYLPVLIGIILVAIEYVRVVGEKKVGVK